MKLIKLILKILLWIAMVILAFLGIRYLICGGWTEIGNKFNELNKNFWELIKWLFSSMFSK